MSAHRRLLLPSAVLAAALSVAPAALPAETLVRVSHLGTIGFEPDGKPALDGPVALAVSPLGLLYVAEQESNRVTVFDLDGRFVGRFGSESVGVPAGGTFFLPSGVATDSAGTVYVSDLGLFGYGGRVQQFTPQGALCAVWAGTPAREFSYPRGVATDLDGHVYVTDWGNNEVRVLAGDGTYLGTWWAPGAWSVAVDDARGRAYVTRYGEIAVFSLAGELQALWKVTAGRIALDPRGRLYATASPGVWIYSPEGELLGQWGGPGFFPSALAVDEQGLVYVAEYSHDHVEVYQVEFD